MKLPNRFSATTIALHWIVAMFMVFLLAMGFLMAKQELWGLYELHKSIGMIAFCFIVLRVMHSVRQVYADAMDSATQWERVLAKTTKWTLVMASVAMPITGMLYSALSGHHVGIFQLELFPANVDPARPKEAISRSPYWESVFQGMHEIIGYLLVLALLLHIAGALKHHFIYRDKTLLRMLGKD